MSLSKALMDATDAMSAADATILRALATGGLEDAPAEVSLALLRCGVSMVQALDTILAHYAQPSETEAPDARIAG
jgi:hypothetical protein